MGVALSEVFLIFEISAQSQVEALHPRRREGSTMISHGEMEDVT